MGARGAHRRSDPEPGEVLGERIRKGFYRFVALSSTFGDVIPGNQDARLYRILKHWPVLWQGDEGGLGGLLDRFRR